MLREYLESSHAVPQVADITRRRDASGDRQQLGEHPMELDLRLQRALDRVELVSGTIGNPGDGKMCLMSLVAFLAGEEHSDSPGCASPLIQAFAVRINDNMPHKARQRLKAFAPRIIGTNDGHDGLRAQVLRRFLTNGTLARTLDCGLTEPTLSASTSGFALRRLWRWLRKDHDQRLLECSLSVDDGVNLAGYAARLVTRLARSAPDARVQDEYWNAAIGLVDALCDVGATNRPEQGIPAARLVQLESTHRGHEEATWPRESFLPPYLLHW
ncbi:hypothetical protein E2C06_20120 [Dankookia rubra]|uniref:Uncharacterized protein n=1 Tax=Dankookia rubra TaxID=1442381 RepID=A0A4R5QD22_9PROT|nr:hypothetical protein [Dankookia rubra]TDH60806.1 hypothetical protein E2C06_20120 [Dankookia rubra]